MGFELARAWVNVRGDSSQLPGDLTKAKSVTMGHLKQLQGSIVGAMGAVGAAGGIAGMLQFIQAGEEFNQKMNQSLAIMGDVSDALRTDMKDSAIEAAKATRASAAEAAEAYFFLASAGLDAEQSIAALPQVAQFAQAGNFGLARATDLATDAQSALGLTVKDAAENLVNLTRVTDVLIKGNTLANASAEQFSEAITNKAGTAARVAGMDIEELTAILAAFADRGVKGAEAGTAVNIVLRDLQTRSRENAADFRELGIRVFDSSGKMRNMADILGQLEKAMEGMEAQQKDNTLAQLGFNDKSKVFIATLIGASEQIREYERHLNNAAGTTKKVSEKQLTPFEEAWNEIAASITATSEALVTSFGPTVSLVFKAANQDVEDFNDTLNSTKTLIGNIVGEETAKLLEKAETDVGLMDLLFPKLKGRMDFVDFIAGALNEAMEPDKFYTSHIAGQRSVAEAAEDHTEAVKETNNAYIDLADSMSDALDKWAEIGSIDMKDLILTSDFGEDPFAEIARKEREEMASESKRLFEDTRTPMEKFHEEMERLKELLEVGPREGGITGEVFDRAIMARQKAVKEEIKSLTDVFGTTTGFRDLGRQIQESLFKDDTQRKMLSELEKQSKFLDTLTRTGGLA